MSTSGPVDFATPADDPRVVAALSKLGRMTRAELRLMSARAIVMLTEAADAGRKLRDEVRGAAYNREAGEKRAAEAEKEAKIQTGCAADARNAMRLARQVLAPRPGQTVGWPSVQVEGERDQRYPNERSDAGYLRGVVDAAVAILDAAT